MTPTSLLRTQGVHLEAGERTLCRDLNWQLQAGECWAIMGLNGAGKTTLLHSLANIHQPKHGEVRLQDQPIQSYSRHHIAQRLALLFQENDVVFPGTVIEHVLIGRHPHLKSWQWESHEDVKIAQHALLAVGMQDFAQRDMQTLSGGEHQRVAIATVLAQQPSIYLLDEPVNHLDWHHQHQLLTSLCGLAKNGSCGLVMVLHDINLVARYCDHVMMMFASGEVRMGDNQAMLQADTLSELYGYEIERIDTGDKTVFVPA